MAKLISVEVLDNFKLRQDAVNDAYFVKRDDIERIEEGLSVSISNNDFILVTDDSPVSSSKVEGVLSLSNIPAEAQERLVIVSNAQKRRELTNDPVNGVQNGDIVHQLDPDRMYYVIDDTNLSSDSSYEEFAIHSAASANHVPWDGVIGKPAVVVTNITTGNNNGEISVFKNGLDSDTFVTGVGMAAYKSDSYYVTYTTFANHTHNNSYSLKNHTHVADSSISSTSTNPVQNKVAKSYIDTSFSNIVKDTSMSSTSVKTPQNKVIKAYVDSTINTSNITIDSEMSATSTKTVQNKVIKSYADSNLNYYSRYDVIDYAVTQDSPRAVAGTGVKEYIDSRIGSTAVDTEMSDTSTNLVSNSTIVKYVDSATTQRLANNKELYGANGIIAGYQYGTPAYTGHIKYDYKGWNYQSGVTFSTNSSVCTCYSPVYKLGSNIFLLTFASVNLAIKSGQPGMNKVSIDFYNSTGTGDMILQLRSEDGTSVLNVVKVLPLCTPYYTENPTVLTTPPAPFAIQVFLSSQHEGLLFYFGETYSSVIVPGTSWLVITG